MENFIFIEIISFFIIIVSLTLNPSKPGPSTGNCPF